MRDVFSNKWIEKSYDTTSDGFGYDFKKNQQDKRGNLYNTLIFLYATRVSTLTKTRNKQKQPETSQNDRKKVAKRAETTQNFKDGEISTFPQAFVFQNFEPGSISFLIFNEIMRVSYFEGTDFKSDIVFSKISSPNAQIWAFWAKKY